MPEQYRRYAKRIWGLCMKLGLMVYEAQENGCEVGYAANEINELLRITTKEFHDWCDANNVPFPPGGIDPDPDGEYKVLLSEDDLVC